MAGVVEREWWRESGGERSTTIVKKHQVSEFVCVVVGCADTPGISEVSTHLQHAKCSSRHQPPTGCVMAAEAVVFIAAAEHAAVAYELM